MSRVSVPQEYMRYQILKLKEAHGISKCAKVLGIKPHSFYHVTNPNKSITVETFTKLYDGLTPENPHLILTYRYGGGREYCCTSFTAEYNNYQSMCKLYEQMNRSLLHLAGERLVLCFVLAKRYYPPNYVMNKSQLISTGRYYLEELEASETPGANELAAKIRKLQSEHDTLLERYIPQYKNLYCVQNQMGQKLLFREPLVSSENHISVKPTAFAKKCNAERLAKNLSELEQNPHTVVEFNPPSMFYPVADGCNDLEQAFLATDSNSWTNKCKEIQSEIPAGEYHVVLTNPQNGDAELWADFVDSSKLEEVKQEAQRHYPHCLCVVGNANEYADPMQLVDECMGSVYEE
jgi:hypothetical protein